MEEMNDIESKRSASQKNNQEELLSSLISGSTLKPLFICLVLQFVQHWCGVIVIIFKSIHVFETFQTSLDHKLATMIVGAVAFIATSSIKQI